MKKLTNIILIANCIAIIIVTILILVNYKKRNYNEKQIDNLIHEIEEKEEITKYKGHNVIGIIRINKIKINYPILEKTNEVTLKISITKFYGKGVNEIGNLTLAGHNNYDGTMFGKIKKLEIDDIIQLTDTKNITKNYSIYKKYITDPNNISILKEELINTRELTLITCTNGNKKRLIIKAREI